MTTLRQIKGFMNEKLIAIEPKASATDAAKLMLENKISSLIVKKNDGTYCGILTEEDISRKFVALEQAPDNTLVKDIMIENVLAVESRSTMRKVF
jgi:signal-transduction protein with cAMP-binding, CBS, and nucleotidyltransferase domain